MKSSTTIIGISLSRLGAILAAAHLLCVALVYSQHYEGSWGYVLFAIPDLPITAALILVNKLMPLGPTSTWIALGVFGSMWWYLVGVWLWRVFSKRG